MGRQTLRDASYFRLPDHDLAVTAPAFLHELENNISAVRTASHKLQQEMTSERSKASSVAAHYELGDLVLWDPLETPHDFKEYKLAPRYSGPYTVSRQVKNDVYCKHVNLGTEHTFHISRLRPFFGSLDDALRVAQLDKNQFLISRTNYCCGKCIM